MPIIFICIIFVTVPSITTHVRIDSNCNTLDISELGCFELQFCHAVYVLVCYGLDAKRSIASREFVFQEGKLKKEEEISSSSYGIEPRNNAKRRSRGPSHNYGLNRHNWSATNTRTHHYRIILSVRDWRIYAINPESRTQTTMGPGGGTGQCTINPTP